MVFNEYSYYELVGRPVVFWLGMLTLLLMYFTASISVLNKKGIQFIDSKWHPIMAAITLIIASITGVMVFLAYMG